MATDRDWRKRDWRKCPLLTPNDLLFLDAAAYKDKSESERILRDIAIRLAAAVPQKKKGKAVANG